MLVKRSLLFTCAVLACLPPSAQASDRTVIAPASGGVEIVAIDVVRRAALGAVKEADLTHMRIDLRFSAKWQRREPLLFDHLVRLDQLSPIVDDHDKLLSTEKRLKLMTHLHAEVHGRQWYQESVEKEGAAISLWLDAPERGAEKIRAIKGRAEVSLARPIHLEFDDLAAINGTELSHPEFPELKNLKLQFAIASNDGEVTAKLTAPFNFSSPWFQGRLSEWSIRAGTNELHLIRKSVSPQGKGVTVEEVYRREGIQGLSLHLAVLKPVESKTFDFAFKDVDLP